MTKYYKAVREDYTDFHAGTVHYEVGGEVTHPRPGVAGSGDAAGYLSVSTSPTDCTGASWPCRLLEVEAVDTWTPHTETLPSKRATHMLQVVREIPAHEVFGPQGEHVVALIERAKALTGPELCELYAAWYAAWYAARYAAGYAARDAAWYAAVDAAGYAAGYAARALVMRDLIGQYGFTQEHYDALTRPWRSVIGKIHPDDKEM